jgi:hypothetical protein
VLFTWYPRQGVSDGTTESWTIRGDLIMRAAILVAGCFLVVSSTFAAEPQVKSAVTKPVAVAMTTGASHEKSVPQGSLEMFGSVGLPQ